MGLSPRVGVVWNVAAGSPDHLAWSTRTPELFPGCRCDVEILAAKRRADLAAAGSRCLDKGCDILVAAGGDGTVSCLASLVLHSPVALGVLPVGTLNHFARDLRLPAGIEAASRVILEGRCRMIDVGEVNGRFFVNNSSLGLYPWIVQRRERWERAGTRRMLAFVAAIFFAFRRYPFLDVHLQVDGDDLFRRSPFVFVGNNEYEIEGLAVGRRSRLDAGILALYTTHRAGRLGLLRIAFSALLRRLRRDREFEIHRAHQLVIATPRRRVSVALDGEVVRMRPPLRYSLRPGALRVMTPA